MHLAMASGLPNLVTPLPGPKAQAVIERDAQFLSPSYTRSYPLVVASGQGSIVEDVDGNQFLDCSAGIAVVATGHCHPQVVEAIQRQAAKLIHMSGTDFYYQNMVDLAQKLAALTPGGLARRVYFGNSGTEAIEAAIKLARYHTGRKQFMAFYGAFHGRTMGSLALTASKRCSARAFPGDARSAPRPLRRLLSLSVRQDARHLCGRVRQGIEDPLFRTVLPLRKSPPLWSSQSRGKAATSSRPRSSSMNCGASRDNHGILLVFDEVQSRHGANRKMFASEHFDAVPDMSRWPKGSPAACR